MALVRFTPTERPKFERTEHLLIGKLLKVTDKGLLIQKINTKCRLWVELVGLGDYISRNGIKVGDTAQFIVTVSSYPSKKDKTIKTRLSLSYIGEKLNEVQDDAKGFEEQVEIKVLKAIPTDIPSLWLVKFRIMSFGGEPRDYHWMRYFNSEAPKGGYCYQCKMEIGLSSKILDSEGHIFEDEIDVEYHDEEGTLITKKVKRWYPAGSISDLELTNK